MESRRARASLCLLSVVFYVHTHCPHSVVAEEPNETFAQSTVLDPGVLSVTDDLSPGEGDAPNTFLGVFDEGGFDPFDNFIADDDDNSTLGNGEASGLSEITVNPDGSVRFIVTGNGDFFFDGDHSEIGGYKAFVEIFDDGGGLIDEFSVNGTLQAGVADQHSFADNSWLGGEYNINLDNTVDGFMNGDVDFFTYTGLNPGSTFSAETSSVGTIDTLLGWYDDAGTLIAMDDDSGTGPLSKLEGTIPASGQLTLAVTGSGDETFVGEHAQQEVYDLVLTIDGAVIPGDFDGDGDVDGFDLTHPTLGWESRYSIDLSGEDFLVWQEAFGAGTLAAVQTVPEPQSAVLLAIVGIIAHGARLRVCVRTAQTLTWRVYELHPMG